MRLVGIELASFLSARGVPVVGAGLALAAKWPWSQHATQGFGLRVCRDLGAADTWVRLAPPMDLTQNDLRAVLERLRALPWPDRTPVQSKQFAQQTNGDPGHVSFEELSADCLGARRRTTRLGPLGKEEKCFGCMYGGNDMVSCDGTHCDASWHTACLHAWYPPPLRGKQLCPACLHSQLLRAQAGSWEGNIRRQGEGYIFARALHLGSELWLPAKALLVWPVGDKKDLVSRCTEAFAQLPPAEQTACREWVAQQQQQQHTNLSDVWRLARTAGVGLPGKHPKRMLLCARMGAIRHSCRPSLHLREHGPAERRWANHEEEVLWHDAVVARTVERGENASHSLLDTFTLLASTRVRQRELLRTRGVCCGCSRCTSEGPDLCRVLPCPHCEGGEVTCSARSQTEKAPTWTCAMCEAAAATKDLPLAGEQRLEELVWELRLQLQNSKVRDSEAGLQPIDGWDGALARLTAVYRDCVGQLGTQHWAGAAAAQLLVWVLVRVAGDSLRMLGLKRAGSKGAEAGVHNAEALEGGMALLTAADGLADAFVTFLSRAHTESFLAAHFQGGARFSCATTRSPS